MTSQSKAIELLRSEFQESVEKIIELTQNSTPTEALLKAIGSEAAHLEKLLSEHLNEERIQLLEVVQPLWLPDHLEENGGSDFQESKLPLKHAAGAIVVVDDEPHFSAPLVQQLERDGYKCVEFSSGREALRHLSENRAQMVLLDVIMPEISGREILEIVKGSEILRNIPIIMTAQRHEMDHIAGSIHEGAEDFLAKPYNPTIVRARVASSIQRKQLREKEQETYLALVQSQKQLAAELAEAAEYVTSLLPDKLSTPVKTDWRYIPSSELGGDSFGYHWIDEDHLAIYLLDVCGHGVGAALLSVSVLNFLRSGTLPAQEARDTSSVMERLNDTFLMERHNDMYFSLWYGVYNARTQSLVFCSGGHPPPILLTPDGKLLSLASGGTVLGAVESLKYQSERVMIPSGSRLYVFSDGVYEIARPNTAMMGYEDFSTLLKLNDTKLGLDGVLAKVREYQGSDVFEDDFSLMEFHFLEITPTSRETLVLHNNMDEWEKLLRFTLEFSVRHGISQDDLDNLDVIMEEVVTNIFKYGGMQPEAEACVINLILKRSFLEIKISDNGHPFNPLLLPDVDTNKGIENRPIGGLGIHFVKKLTVSQHYEYRDGKNILTLVKELKEALI